MNVGNFFDPINETWDPSEYSWFAARAVSVSVAYDSNLKRFPIFHHDQWTTAVSLYNNIKQDINAILIFQQKNFENIKKKRSLIYLTRVFIVRCRSAHVCLRDRPIHGAFVIRDNRYGGVLQPLCSGSSGAVFAPSNHHPRFIGVCVVPVTDELDWSNVVWKKFEKKKKNLIRFDKLSLWVWWNYFFFFAHLTSEWDILRHV